MNLLILSDTHGHPERVREVLNREGDIDAIIFLGDGYMDFEGIQERLSKVVYAVRGNCDSLLSNNPKSLILNLEGHQLLLCHGDEYFVKGGRGALLTKAKQTGSDIVLFGHTHERCDEYISTPTPIYLFNPGSLGNPREGEPSFGRLYLTKDTILFSFGTL